MSSGYERNRMRLVAMLVVCLLFSTVFYGCGGGGDGSVVTGPQYGSIVGYVYAPIGSGARVAAAAPAGKKAVQGAKVSVSCGSTQKISTTNDSGFFSIASLPIGNCSLTVTYNGFRSYQTDISLSSYSTTIVGGSSGISIFPTTFGSITVRANVSGGRVWIDGEPTGITIPISLSYTFDGIEPGTHTVSISQAGMKDVNAQNSTVVQGGTESISFTMSPTNGGKACIDGSIVNDDSCSNYRIYIEPIQCAMNPWEEIEGPQDESAIIKDYYESNHGLDIKDIKQCEAPFTELCFSCDCSRGDIYSILVSSDDAIILISENLLALPQESNVPMNPYPVDDDTPACSGCLDCPHNSQN